MTTVILKPAPGARVRFPNNPARLLREEGDRVELDSAWRRLMKAGDVVEVVPDPPPPEDGTTRATLASPAPEGVEGTTRGKPYKARTEGGE